MFSEIFMYQNYNYNFFFTEKYILEDPKNYTFLSGGPLTVGNMDDLEEFHSLLESMHIMGLTEDEISSIWRVIR